MISGRRGHILQGSGEPKRLQLRSQGFVPIVLRTYTLILQIYFQSDGTLASCTNTIIYGG